MKLVIVVALALVAVAVAAPVDEPIEIKQYKFDPQPDGSYDFGFESANGIGRSETGVLKEALDEENKPHQVVVVRGFYYYPNVDGTPERIEYFADETGYHAKGPSIPVNPLAASRR